jgi:ubiquinone/menaquinone biosynthesis C-methylase UbiE
MMIRGAQIFLAMLFALTACSGPGGNNANEGGEPAGQADGAAIDDEETNLDLWLERLEVGSRELYSARDAVVEAVGLKEGDWVADIGAGTGLYTVLFAEEVGASGRVLAEDIEPLFLDLINRRAADLSVDNITAVLGREDDVTLPKSSVDVVFIADTYHYFEDREAVMRSIYEALKPGGSLILVEFDITPGEQRPDYKSHVRFGKAGVISEVEFIGFKLADAPVVEGLDENYFVRFVKPATP